MTNEFYKGTVFLHVGNALTCIASSYDDRALVAITAGSLIIDCFGWNSFWPSRYSFSKLDVTISMLALL